MTEMVKGKCLVRRCSGTNNVIICGVFIPSRPIDTFSDCDEMWAVEFAVTQVVKFEGYPNTEIFSPEDFLENHNDIQKPEYWKRK